MGRKFTDAWLMPESEEEASRMIRRASELGYEAVAMEASDEVFKTASNEAWRVGLEIYRRKTIKVESRDLLYEELSRRRWKYDLIVLETKSRDASIAALRDMRVDALLISHPDAITLDKHLIAVANNAVEISMRDVIDNAPLAISKLIRSLRFVIKGRIKALVSSGAKDAFYMRSPRQLVSILWALGVNLSDSLDAVSTTPYEILKVNKAKIAGHLDPGGIWRVAK